MRDSGWFEHDDAAAAAFGLVEAAGVIKLQYPFGHRVRHHGETGEEMMPADGKQSGDVVKRIGHQFRAFRENPPFSGAGRVPAESSGSPRFRLRL